MISTLPIRRAAAAALCLCALIAAGAAGAPSPANAVGKVLALSPAHTAGTFLAPSPASAADYVPGEVVVGYAPSARSASLTSDLRTAMGLRMLGATTGPSTHVLRLPRGLSVTRAISRLRGRPGIAYAVPNFVAHAAGSFIPNDPGRAHRRAGWEALQWNFLPGAGVNAPQAWANLIADKRPGGRGVVVAVLDSGVAYRNWHQFTESPDFRGTRFVAPHDFVANNRYPLDREGHGTFVTGTVAEATDNGVALTGLAYGATIMPVRILDASGNGDAVTISRGIRYAVTHGAQVINLSLEFSLSVTAGQIPDIISALQFAHRHGVVVVAAAGNESVGRIAYPAQGPAVIAVGASTRDRCLADYSNAGPGLDLVAPGGGDDSSVVTDRDCHPARNLPSIYQETILDPAHPGRFGLPGDFYGTSMATPHVAATAALVIASGVLGRRPSPDRILARLEATAQPLGGSKPNRSYGYGLLDAGAATAP